jgi:hypothetical protein
MATKSDNRYQNGKIYKLVNNVDDEIYVGSTCLPLYKRLSNHRYDAKKEKMKNTYKHLNNIGWESVKIILIENYPCDSKDELLARERYWYDKLKPSINRQRPLVTKEEYLQYFLDYNDRNKEKRKEYHDTNKENLAKKVICNICKCEMRKDSIRRHEKSKTHLNNLASTSEI